MQSSLLLMLWRLRFSYDFLNSMIFFPTQDSVTIHVKAVDLSKGVKGKG